MAQGKIKGGIITILVDNEPINVFGDWEYSTGDQSSEVQSGADQHRANIITKETPFIRGRGRDAGKLDVDKFNGLEGVPVQAVLPNGKSVVWEDCVQTTQVVRGSGDAGFDLEFMQLAPGPAKEIKAA